MGRNREEGGGAVAGSYTRWGNLWDLVVLNLWNLNVDESYHRDCPQGVRKGMAWEIFATEVSGASKFEDLGHEVLR